MKLLRILGIIMLILVLAVLGIYLTNSRYLLKGLQATYLNGTTTASIGDAKFFDLREVPATNPQAWPVGKEYNQMDLSDRLRQALEETESVAFLVIKNDSIRYEEYWHGYNDTSHSNSFSMAKSITSLLVQKAIQDGYIQSWEDKVIDYLPEIQGAYRKELRLKHLSNMTAGLQWNEDYANPFGITARAYYGDDIKETMFERVPVVIKPGSKFEYQSGAPQLLGIILTRATGMSVSEYASKTLWKSLGARQNAQWHLDDKDGQELTYCCFNSNARDFARYGKLLINHGKWDNRSVIDSAFIARANQPGPAPYYGWSFWILQDALHHTYYMRGHHGQYVIVIPEKDLVICRLGKKAMPQEDHHHQEFRVIVEEAVKYFGN